MKQGDMVSIQIKPNKYILGQVIYLIENHVSVDTEEYGRLLVEDHLIKVIKFNPDTFEWWLFTAF